jgi:hypothetical protein
VLGGVQACFGRCWGSSLPWDARETEPRLVIRRPKARRVALLQAQSHAPIDWLALHSRASHGPSPPPHQLPLFALLPQLAVAGAQPSARVMLAVCAQPAVTARALEFLGTAIHSQGLSPQRARLVVWYDSCAATPAGGSRAAVPESGVRIDT